MIWLWNWIWFSQCQKNSAHKNVNLVSFLSKIVMNESYTFWNRLLIYSYQNWLRIYQYDNIMKKLLLNQSRSYHHFLFRFSFDWFSTESIMSFRFWWRVRDFHDFWRLRQKIKNDDLQIENQTYFEKISEKWRTSATLNVLYQLKKTQSLIMIEIRNWTRRNDLLIKCIKESFLTFHFFTLLTIYESGVS